MPKTRSLAALFFLLLLFVTPQAFSQPAWLAGERLLFTAEFLHMELGWLHFEMLAPVDTLGATLLHARVTIQSNPRLPLVHAHFVFESYFDEAFNSYVFTSQERRADGVRYSMCEFNRTGGTINIREWRKLGENIVEAHDNVLPLLPEMRDGIALFYFLRSIADVSLAPARAFEPQPFYVLSGQRPDSIFFSRKAPTKFSGKQIPYSRSITSEQGVVPISCRLPFTGIAGLKKEIHSYFSTDGLALPLSTELQVYIGKVRLRLVEQHRRSEDLTAQITNHRSNVEEILRGIPK